MCDFIFLNGIINFSGSNVMKIDICICMGCNVLGVVLFVVMK